LASLSGQSPLYQNAFLSLLECYGAVDEPDVSERLWIISEMLAGLWIHLL
jgi:hypothetical protein